MLDLTSKLDKVFAVYISFNFFFLNKYNIFRIEVEFRHAGRLRFVVTRMGIIELTLIFLLENMFGAAFLKKLKPLGYPTTPSWNNSIFSIKSRRTRITTSPLHSTTTSATLNILFYFLDEK